MDSETKAAIDRLRDRVASVNDSLDLATQAIFSLQSECDARFDAVDNLLQLLIDESRFSRKQIFNEIDAIKRRIEPDV